MPKPPSVSLLRSLLALTAHGWRGTQVLRPSEVPAQLRVVYDRENDPQCRLLRERLCELELAWAHRAALFEIICEQQFRWRGLGDAVADLRGISSSIGCGCADHSGADSEPKCRQSQLKGGVADGVGSNHSMAENEVGSTAIARRAVTAVCGIDINPEVLVRGTVQGSRKDVDRIRPGETYRLGEHGIILQVVRPDSRIDRLVGRSAQPVQIDIDATVVGEEASKHAVAGACGKSDLNADEGIVDNGIGAEVGIERGTDNIVGGPRTDGDAAAIALYRANQVVLQYVAGGRGAVDEDAMPDVVPDAVVLNRVVRRVGDVDAGVVAGRAHAIGSKADQIAGDDGAAGAVAQKDAGAAGRTGDQIDGAGVGIGADESGS